MTLRATVKTLILAYVLVWVGPSGFCSADDGDYVVGETGEAIRDYVELVHERLGFSGVVLAARDGKVIAAIARGHMSTEAGSPLTYRSLFEIGSCTKPFTAIAVLQLHQSGKLSLDDPIAAHLPGVPASCGEITVRHLLSHTSGIPGTNTTGSGDDLARVLPTFLAGGPVHPPGTHYEYWNQGYALLSEIIARASGRPYTEYIRDEIFTRGGMQASRFTGDEAPEGVSVAVGTSTRGRPRSALDHPYGSYGFQYRGMGGIVTNVQDLWKWDRAIQKNSLIGQDAFATMTTSGAGKYGLGWFVDSDPDGKPSHRHGGSVRGFLSEIRRYPSIDGALFVLANQDDSMPIAVLRSGVEKFLFGIQPESEIPQVPDEQFVSRVAGEYFDAKNRRLLVEATSGLPVLKVFWGGPITVGYLGLGLDGKPRLYLAIPNQDDIKFTADTILEFSSGGAKAQSVSMLGLNPKLTFQRPKR